MANQCCPLCGTPAVFTGHDYGRRKGFSCPVCTEFILTVSAEAKLEELIQTYKDHLSEKARATPEGQVLLIYVPDHNQDGAPSTELLRAEYQQREY